MLNYEDYTVKDVEYPDRPSKPANPGSRGTSADFAKYADELKEYEAKKAIFDERRTAYNKRVCELEAKFRKDLYEDCGVTGHPKADTVFSIAWEYGHSSGHSEVANYFYRLVEIIQ